MTSLQLSILAHGDPAQFLCTAVGEPPLRYKWYKDGKPLAPRRVDHRTNASSPVLKLKEVVLSDEGNFTCHAWNKRGMIQHSFTLKVIGKEHSVYFVQCYSIREVRSILKLGLGRQIKEENMRGGGKHGRFYLLR